jgi:hypothetical protein
MPSLLPKSLRPLTKPVAPEVLMALLEERLGAGQARRLS